MGKIISLIKNYFVERKIRKEGGQKTSLSLRANTLEKYKVEVGMHSYGSCFKKEFNVGGTVKIGRYCSFGPDVRYFGGNHPMEYASMSPYFYNKGFGGYDVKDIERSSLSVGHDCWIGCNSIILNGCKSIGNGAVIGAGAVVTKDVEPYSVVVGTPAKHIKYRFDKNTIELLEKSRWYDLEPDELIKYYEDIDKPQIFAKRIMSDYDRH